jgi:shikimate kinase
MSIKNKHVFLCGFMGSGKSTLGRHLSKRMNRKFIDLDNFIEERTQKNVTELFKEQGEKAFRLLETRYLFEVVKMKESCVIALGGGTVCSPINLDIIKQSGVLVYISLTADELFNRLKNSNTKRPLIKGLSKEALKLYVHRMLEERLADYQKAHLQLNGVGLNDTVLLEAINHHAK